MDQLARAYRLEKRFDEAILLLEECTALYLGLASWPYRIDLIKYLIETDQEDRAEEVWRNMREDDRAVEIEGHDYETMKRQMRESM